MDELDLIENKQEKKLNFFSRLQKGLATSNITAFVWVVILVNVAVPLSVDLHM